MVFQNFFKQEYIYEYVGVSQLSGKVVKGTVTAKNEKDAWKKLSFKKITVKQLKKESKKFGSRIKNKNIFIFFRQLSTMLKSGIPLIRALEIIANGAEDSISMKNLVLDIKKDVEQGMSLASALSKHYKYFDRLCCGLVATGEVAGTLDKMLNNIADYQEKIINIKRKVISSLIYPLIILIVAISAIVLILLFVLPKFEEMYDSLGASLPFITQVVVNASRFVYSYGLYFLIFIIWLYIFLKNRLKKSRKFKEKVDNLIIKVPIFGKIIRNALISRWGRTLSILLGSGITLINSLDLVSNVTDNIVYENATKNIKTKVNQGETLANSINSESNYLFPIMFLQMAMVGEESGTLDNMLERASAYYEQEVDSSVSILSTLIEPFVIIILGIIIGIMVLAMYAPLWHIGGA